MIKQLKQKLINRKEARKNNAYYHEGYVDGRKEKIEEYENEKLDLIDEHNLTVQDLLFVINKQKNEISDYKKREKKRTSEIRKFKNDVADFERIVENIKPVLHEIVTDYASKKGKIELVEREVKKISR